MIESLPSVTSDASGRVDSRISSTSSRRLTTRNSLLLVLPVFVGFTLLSVASLSRFDYGTIRPSLFPVHAAPKLHGLPQAAASFPSRRVSEASRRPSNPIDCGGKDSCCRKVAGSKYDLHQVVQAHFSANVSGQMSTYMFGDIISRWVQSTGVWDRAKTRKMLAQLKSLGRNAVLLDIGANIGWFTLAAAYAGFQVVAIEPYERNLANIQHSLCLAPQQVRDRIVLLHSGLGIRDNVSCSLMQNPSANHGNTHTSCTDRPYQAGYRKLGEVHLNRLDSLVAAGNISLITGSKIVVKVDTEGYEPFAIMGGERFFRQLQPASVYSEFCPHLMVLAAQALGWSKEKASKLPDQYLRTMKELGYRFANPDPQKVNQDIVFARKL